MFVLLADNARLCLVCLTVAGLVRVALVCGMVGQTVRTWLSFEAVTVTDGAL